MGTIRVIGVVIGRRPLSCRIRMTRTNSQASQIAKDTKLMIRIRIHQSDQGRRKETPVVTPALGRGERQRRRVDKPNAQMQRRLRVDQRHRRHCSIRRQQVIHREVVHSARPDRPPPPRLPISRQATLLHDMPAVPEIGRPVNSIRRLDPTVLIQPYHA